MKTNKTSNNKENEAGPRKIYLSKEKNRLIQRREVREREVRKDIDINRGIIITTITLMIRTVTMMREGGVIVVIGIGIRRNLHEGEG